MYKCRGNLYLNDFHYSNYDMIRRMFDNLPDEYLDYFVCVPIYENKESNLNNPILDNFQLYVSGSTKKLDSLVDDKWYKCVSWYVTPNSDSFLTRIRTLDVDDNAGVYALIMDVRTMLKLFSENFDIYREFELCDEWSQLHETPEQTSIREIEEEIGMSDSVACVQTIIFKTFKVNVDGKRNSCHCAISLFAPSSASSSSGVWRPSYLKPENKSFVEPSSSSSNWRTQCKNKSSSKPPSYTSRKRW